MQNLGTRFGGEPGSVKFAVGLHDLKGLSQPKWFYDSKVVPLQNHSPQVQNLNQRNHQWAKIFLSLLCKAGVGKPMQRAVRSRANWTFPMNLLGKKFKIIQC